MQELSGEAYSVARKGTGGSDGGTGGDGGPEECYAPAHPQAPSGSMLHDALLLYGTTSLSLPISCQRRHLTYCVTLASLGQPYTSPTGTVLVDPTSRLGGGVSCVL